MADDGVDHHPGSRRLVVLSEEGLLLVPGLAGRVVDRGLADQMPPCLPAILGKRLLVVPVLVVEQALIAGNLATDLENREREDGGEDVRVLALLEHRLGERDFGKGGGLLPRWIDPEVPDRFLDAEVVTAHDLAGALLAGRRFETSVPDHPHHFHGGVVALRVDDSLGEFVGETCGLELQEHFVLLMHRQGTAYYAFHSTPPVGLD